MNEPASTFDIQDGEHLPEQPLVSVCMLAYKHEKYIAQAIECVLAQQCDFPVELVIGEDCSPDRTRAIALGFQRLRPDVVRIITSKENVGMMANFRRTLTACRGRYIAFCEGDDYWTDPSKLRRQVDLFARHPRVMLAAHPARELDEPSGMLRGMVRPAFSSRLLSMHELILGDGGLIPSPSIMFRRELVGHLAPWFDASPVGDYPLVLAAGLHGDVAVQNLCMCVYRRNVPGSWSGRQGPDFAQRWKNACRIDAFLARFDTDTAGKYARETRRLTSKLYSDALVRFFGNTETKRMSYESVSARLDATDRMFCWLVLHTPWTFVGLKTALRKARSLFRILQGEMTMPRL